jgi:hypothetical protein
MVTPARGQRQLKQLIQMFEGCSSETAPNSKRPSQGRPLFQRCKAYETITGHNRKSSCP